MTTNARHRYSAPLRVRSQLRERRPISVRRHTGRLATRFVVLLAGDLCALLGYQALSVGLADVSLAGRFLWAQNLGVFAVFLIGALFVTGSYSRHRGLNESIRLAASAAIASLVVLAELWIPDGKPSALLFAASTGILTLSILFCERRLTEWFLQRFWPRQRGTAPALLIATGTPLDHAIERAIMAPGGDYRIASTISAHPSELGVLSRMWDDILEQITTFDIEAVVLCGSLPSSHMQRLMDITLESGAQLLYPARAVDIPDVRPSLVWHSDQPFFELGAPVLKATALITKRIVDIVGASVTLLLTAPLLVVIAIAVRFDSPGAILFVQPRAGLGGKRFSMLKFRTMREGADLEKPTLSHLNHTGDPRLFKIPDDPRITPLGRFLRRWSLDELPQIFNVFIGDMSLVGPRPFFESDFLHYEDHHFRRLDAKPGISGLWQVSGGSDVLNFEDVIYLDRQYIEQWSFWLDVSIMFRTIPAIFRRSELY